MDRPFNLFVPLGCPHCRAELLPTFDQVQQGESVRCPACGTTVELQPDDLPIPVDQRPESQDFLVL